MKKISSIEGCDEATARLVVTQEQAHGRFVETHQVNGRWYVSVYLSPAALTLTTNAPDWLRKVWKRQEAP